MSNDAVRRVDSSLRSTERGRALELRAIRATEGRVAVIGDLWSIRPEVSSEGLVLEHSWSSVVVAVLRELGPVVEVAPIRFDVDFLADDEVLSDQPLFERPFVVECWARMPALRQALWRRVGELAAKQRVEFEMKCGSRMDDVLVDDAQAAFRQSEHLRVLFACAGALAALGGGKGLIDDASLELKRHFAEDQAAVLTRLAELGQYASLAVAPDSPTSGKTAPV